MLEIRIGRSFLQHLRLAHHNFDFPFVAVTPHEAKPRGRVFAVPLGHAVHRVVVAIRSTVCARVRLSFSSTLGVG